MCLRELVCWTLTSLIDDVIVCMSVPLKRVCVCVCVSVVLLSVCLSFLFEYMVACWRAFLFGWCAVLVSVCVCALFRLLFCVCVRM